jgi:hypothetical protein
MSGRKPRNSSETIRRWLLAFASKSHSSGGIGTVAGNRQFDEDRFRELVLYIANKTQDDPTFGRTKLAKVLFYSDFIAYAEDGRSLTGATYRAIEHGPFPTQLSAAENQLRRDKRAIVERWDPPEEKGEYDPNRIIPKDDPDVGRLELWELAYVDIWIGRVAEAKTASEISKLSHDHPGWQLFEQNRGIIPYETQFIGTKPPHEPVPVEVRRAHLLPRRRRARAPR